MLLEQMIQEGQLIEFIDELIKIVNEEKHEKTMWEYYLHRIYDRSFAQFMDEHEQSPEESESNLEATVKQSYEMMKNFHPE